MTSQGCENKQRHGRPRAINDEAAKKILDALRIGCTRDDAAASAGICARTLRNEIARNSVFAAAVGLAQAIGKQRLVARVNRSSRDDWKAAAWLLERRWPKEWGKRSPDAVTPEQMASAIGRVVAMILEVVPQRYHNRVAAQVNQLTGKIADKSDFDSKRRRVS